MAFFVAIVFSLLKFTKLCGAIVSSAASNSPVPWRNPRLSASPLADMLLSDKHLTHFKNTEISLKLRGQRNQHENT